MGRVVPLRRVWRGGEGGPSPLVPRDHFVLSVLEVVRGVVNTPQSVEISTVCSTQDFSLMTCQAVSVVFTE